MKTNRYRYSQFNTEVDNGDGQYVIYNSASNIISVLSRNEADFYSDLSRAQGTITQEDHAVLDGLLAKNFIVPTDADELTPLRVKYMQSRSSKESLTLTIAPTLNCNFSCRYCYQGSDKDTGMMSSESQENAIRYIKEHSHPGSGVKRINLTWFGGEPLLAVPAIKNISDRVIAWCDRNKLVYSAMLITNGYLLDAKTVGELYVRRVRGIQVTLDGDEETHNKVRFLKNKQAPTFKAIVDNIRLYSEEYPIQTSIRVNLDKNNTASAYKLIDQLAEAGLGNKNVSIYFAPIVSSTSACHSVSEDTLDIREYAEIEFDLLSASERAGFWKASMPPRFMGLCGAAKPGGTVIAANGDIHKCWETISFKDKRISRLACEATTEELRNEALWNSFTPFDFAECKSCAILPNCAGFCAYKFLYSGEFAGSSGKLPCPSLRFNINNRILHYTKSNGMLQNIKFSHIHGYPSSILDNSIRTFLTNGQVIAFSFSPKGLIGRLMGQEIKLPQQIIHIANASSLAAFLKGYKLSVADQQLLLHK